MSTACTRSSTVAAVAFGVIAGAACSPEEVGRESFPTTPNSVSLIAGIPPGWFGGSAQTDQYELGRDVEVVHGGRTSAYLRSKTSQPSFNSFVTITQLIRADDFRGKRIRYSGYIRTNGVSGAVPDGLGLWMRADAPRGSVAFDNMGDRRRSGTQDWTYAEIVLDIPDNVVGLAFGALLAGPGMAWVDDLKIEIVGTNVPLTAPVNDQQGGADSAATVANYSRMDFTPSNLDFEGISYPESNAATVEWMKSHSVSFLTDDPTAPDADLEPLRAMLGNAGLVALGESTHGTREFFRMKHRVFSWLVRNKGFTQFGIEASMPEALAVDHYVQTGNGDPATLVRGMGFWTWSTDEVVDLVRWMRQWNASGGQPRVHFTGFDMQAPGVAMDSVQAFATAMSATSGAGVQAAYACLGPYRNTPNRAVQRDAYAALPQSEQDQCRTKLASVDSMFVNNMDSWSTAAGAERVRLMQRLARLVSQWEGYARTAAIGAASIARDVAMAENAAFWRSRTSGTGTMLWAHNFHISRQPNAMGSHLGARYGSDYVSMAQTFSSGNFNAVNQTASGVFTALQSHGLSGSWPGSIEAMLDATGLTQALFDTRQAVGAGTPSAIRRQMTMRSIGSTFAPTASPSAYQARTLFPEDFDIVIWFRNASASRLLSSAAVKNEFGFQVASP